MMFLVEFDLSLIFQWFEGIFGVRMVIFDGVKSGEMLDFSGFYPSRYRSGCYGVFGVKYLGNADFTRSLWIEQICRSWLPAACYKM